MYPDAEQLPYFLTFSHRSDHQSIFLKIIVWGGCQDIVETEVIASSQNGKKAMLLGCIWRENPNSVENLGGFPGRKRAAEPGHPSGVSEASNWVEAKGWCHTGWCGATAFDFLWFQWFYGRSLQKTWITKCWFQAFPKSLEIFTKSCTSWET